MFNDDWSGAKHMISSANSTNLAPIQFCKLHNISNEKALIEHIVALS